MAKIIPFGKFAKPVKPVLTIGEIVDRYIEFQNSLRARCVNGTLTKAFLDQMDAELAFLEKELRKHGEREIHK